MKIHLVIATLFVALFVACNQPTPAPSPTAAPKTGATPAQPATTPGRAESKVTVAPKAGTPEVKAKISPAAPFYQGKTVTVSTSNVGGGTDTLARLTAAFLPRYLPGNPKMIVRNQPGSQGVAAANIFVEKAKPDGLTLMVASTGVISLQLKKEAIVKYDLTKLRYIGNVSRAESILVIRRGLKGRLTDPRAQPVVTATQEGTETWQAMTLWGKEFLGWNIRWIPGLSGTAEGELMLRRGELDMTATANAFIIRRLIQEGIAEPVATLGTIKGGKFARRPDFPDVPTFDEIIGGKRPTGLSWQAFMAWVGPNMVDKFVAAPTGTPDDILGILTDSYARMVKDLEFDAMVRKTVSEVYEVSIGRDTEALIKAVVDVPDEAIQYGIDLQIKHGIISK